MKVRAKTMLYIYDKRVREDEEVLLQDLKAHKRLKDGKLEPYILKAKDQFSKRNMELIDESKESAVEEKKSSKAKVKSSKEDSAPSEDVI